MSAVLRVSLIAICLLMTAYPSTQVTPVYGAESPQAVMAAMERAIAADDFSAVMPLVSPDGRKDLAEDAISGLILALKFLDPDGSAPEMTSIPEPEREAKRRSYRAAVDVARTTLRPHRLDGLIGQAPISPNTRDIMELALSKTDTVVLMRSLFAALEQIRVLLNMEHGDEKKMPWNFGKVASYEINGDHATAKTDDQTIEFERVDDRWYFKPSLK